MFRAVSPIFNLFRKVEPVDRVIPWVNSIDPEYMNDREKYYESADNSLIRVPDINNNELELKTAILCIIKNIDWKGTMFIVTSFNQLPRSYYKLKKYIIKLKNVFQKEIFPRHLKYALPIFNSLRINSSRTS